MNFWHKLRVRKWLGKGLAAVLAATVLTSGHTPAQAPRMLPPLAGTAPVEDNKPIRSVEEARAIAVRTGGASTTKTSKSAPVPKGVVNAKAESATTNPANKGIVHAFGEIFSKDSAPGKGVVHAKAEAPAPAVAKIAADGPMIDPAVKQASCCGGLLGAGYGGHGGCAGGSCGNGRCYPGREHCSWCNYDSCWGRFIGCLYDCICCPDPCYEPRWIPEANNAFFQDGARPVTQTRIRWDYGINNRFPDTAEYFWAKIGGNGPKNFERGINHHDLTIYNEVAARKASVFVEMPYRLVAPANDIPGDGPLERSNPQRANWGDMNVGTKAMLLDCELIQMTFQFRTFIPIGNASKGLGTGHVSLEPSLLTTIKCAAHTYLQTQISQWIPIGGDGEFQGSTFHYHIALNHALWRPHPDFVLIGSLELNGWTFQDGRYTESASLNGTDTEFDFASAGGRTYMNFGGGFRFVLCNKVDLGVGFAHGINGDHGPEQLYRTEFRLRF